MTPAIEALHLLKLYGPVNSPFVSLRGLYGCQPV
jgi:hypothetical protein